MIIYIGEEIGNPMSGWNRNTRMHKHSLPRRIARGLRERIKGAISRPHDRPILILGNQKSGTTAIANLLGKATGLPVRLDFFYLLDEPVEERLYTGHDSIGAFVERYSHFFSQPIVKEPGLTFLVDQLLTVFPASPMVFIVRDPRDNVRSLLNRLHLPGNLLDLNEGHFRNMPNDIWRSIMDGTALGVHGDSYIDTQANRWVKAVAAYERYASAMILVRYEDFREDKPGEIGKLAAALGLEATHDITAEMNRQFQSAGDHSVSWEEFFGEVNLERINRIAGPKARSLGYRI